jgi:hypothetical protein
MPGLITSQRSRSEYDELLFQDVSNGDGAQSGRSQSPVNSSISLIFFSQDFSLSEKIPFGRKKTVPEFLYYSDITSRCRDTGYTQ